MKKNARAEISSTQAAALLGINRNALHSRVTRGRLAPSRQGGGGKGKGSWFYEDDVLAMKAADEKAVEPDEAPRRTVSKAKAVEQAEERFAEKVLERFGADALSQRYEPTVRWALDTSGPKTPGVPMLFISDIHYGEVVDSQQILGSNSFDAAICKRRLRHTFETAATLLRMHFAAPDYNGIVLVLGGDMVNGALHEENPGSNDRVPLVQAIEIARLLADSVAFLAKEFPRVTVYCVPGNHGRLTRRPWAKFYAQTNLDWLAYVMLADYCRDLENVEINAPPVRDLTFGVANRRYRLTHGDQFRGGDGIIGPLGPVTRGDVRKRFSSAQMPAASNATYDTLLVGHFHQLLMLPRLVMNGSVKGFDEYALSINVPYEPPQQALWTVHPLHGQTWYMPVLCDAVKHRLGRN